MCVEACVGHLHFDCAPQYIKKGLCVRVQINLVFIHFIVPTFDISYDVMHQQWLHSEQRMSSKFRSQSKFRYHIPVSPKISESLNNKHEHDSLQQLKKCKTFNTILNRIDFGRFDI